MPEDRIKVGFIGCGGIARSLYTGIYAALPELAQVVAVADLVDDLAENRRQVLKDAYQATAYGARAAADLARADEDKDAALHKAGAAESAAAYDIRKYGNHEDLLRDDPDRPFALDLGRCGARPDGSQADDRFADVGGELDRNLGQRQNAEHDDGYHRRHHGDGAFDGKLDKVHGEFMSGAWPWAPSRRP